MEVQTTDKPERRGPVYCRRCSRELTHPDSYAAGIGPECAERWGICQAELARLNMQLDPNLVSASMDDGPSIIRLSQDGTQLGLRFRYDTAVLAQVKTIPGRRWDMERRLWTIPATKAGLTKALEVLPQARIYIKDLERIKTIMDNGATPEVMSAAEAAGFRLGTGPGSDHEFILQAAAAAAPAQVQEVPKATLFDGKIIVKFPYTQELVTNVKSLPGRRWIQEKKYWTLPVSFEAIAKLREWGFQFSPELEAKEDSLAPIKNVVYFSLCPLYNIIQKYGGWENAERGLYQKAQQVTGRSNAEELFQGAYQRSQSQSQRSSDSECSRPRMEETSIQSNQRSYAPTRSPGETPQRTGKSQEETRGEFQGRMRTGTNRDNPLSGEHSGTTRIHPGVSGFNQEAGQQLPECTKCIQNRLRQPGSDGGNRSGRTSTSEQGAKSQRSQEVRNAESPWVDCPTLTSLNPDFFDKLYPFQRDAVRFIEARQGRALIAFEMGLGKTVLALSWLKLHPEVRPAIVVCPASIKINWAREAIRWLDKQDRVQVINGRPNGDTKPTGNIIIINYDILSDETAPDPRNKTKRIPVSFGWWKYLRNLKPKALICDESQALKNHKALRTQALKDLARGIPHVLAMSGTPILNRPIEFYNTIQLIRPELFPSWWDFTQRFCGRRNTRFGVDVSGASNTDELHRILTDTIMTRCLKKDVLHDLPDKIRSVLPLEMTNRKEYNEAAADFLGWLERKEGAAAADRAAGAEALVAIGKLKQLAARGKMKAAKAWITEVIESGEKLILFAVHHWVVDEIVKEFGSKAVRLTGKESQTQRQEAVDAFQNNDKVRLFVGNILAAGIGITLTAATQVAFLELPWQPGACDQAEDRAHRIGQRMVVNINYLVAEGTIEEDIAQLLDEKRTVLASVLDGEIPAKTEMLKELLARMRVRGGKNV
jgi:SWI/SNF-related matrix-associated actin-dependent regulator 1 of chromatin subfamily A